MAPLTTCVSSFHTDLTLKASRLGSVCPNYPELRGIAPTRRFLLEGMSSKKSKYTNGPLTALLVSLSPGTRSSPGACTVCKPGCCYLMSQGLMKRLVARRPLGALQTLCLRALTLARTRLSGAFLHFHAVLLALSRRGSVLAGRLWQGKGSCALLQL